MTPICTRTFCQQTAAKLVAWAPDAPTDFQETAGAKGHTPTPEPMAAPLDEGKRHKGCRAARTAGRRGESGL